jgi:hypothetical protein
MSLIGNNIIYNGDFDAFSINDNEFMQYQQLTTDQKTDFCWDTSTEYNILLNNGTNLFNLPDPEGVLQNSQYVIITNAGMLKQSINITQTGTYQLTFNYAVSSNSPPNQMQIWFNGVLSDTITTSSINWTPYTYNIDVLTTGAQDLLFQGQLIVNGNIIGFSNVDFRLIKIINNNPNPTPTPAVNNILNNGKFALPTLAVNTSTKMNRGGFITGWTYANTQEIVLCNGVANEFVAPTSTNQYVYLIHKPSITQTINITQVGTYNFSMEYCKTKRANCNVLAVTMDGNFVTSTPVIYGTNWTTLYGQVQILTTGNHICI